MNPYVKHEIDLDTITLVGGVGDLSAHTACVMSLAAALAGEAHGDRVTCACPVVRSFAIRLNDRMSDADRQKLKPVALEILGTKGSRALELRRAYRCADWAVREVLPGVMDAAKLSEHAAALRALAPIVDRETALAGRAVARKAAAADDAAAYAAAKAADAADATADAAAADAADAYAAAKAAKAAAKAAKAAYAADADAAYADAADDAYAADDAAAVANANANAADRSIAFLRELCAMREEV